MTTTAELIQAVADRIRYFYGDGIPIFTEEQKEGFEAPSFFIREVSRRVTPLWDNRREISSVIDVSYYPARIEKRNVEDRADAQGVQDTLLLGLEIVTDRAGNPVRGADLEAAWADGVLHLTATYAYFILLTEEKAPYMETLELTQRIGE